MELMSAARKYQKEIIERWAGEFTELIEEVSFDVILDGKKYRTRLDGIAERAGKFIVVEAKMGEAVFSKPQKMFMKVLKEGVGEIKPVGNNAIQIFGKKLTGTNVRDVISKQVRLNDDIVDITTATVRGLK